MDLARPISYAFIRLFLQAIEAGNHEGARIYGQDAIREKNQALNHLRMASRLDACCSRIETAVRMNQVSAGMKGVVKGMDKSLASMNIEQLSGVMEKFESQFEDLDVKVRCRYSSRDDRNISNRSLTFLPLRVASFFLPCFTHPLSTLATCYAV